MTDQTSAKPRKSKAAQLKGGALAAAVMLGSALAAASWQQSEPVTSEAAIPAPIQTPAATRADPAADASIGKADPAALDGPQNRVVTNRASSKGLASPATTAVETASTAAAASETEAATPDQAAEEQTLYLTIIGDRTFLQSGAVADGPPSMNDLKIGAGATTGYVAFATDPGPTTSSSAPTARARPPGAGIVATTSAAGAQPRSAARPAGPSDSAASPARGASSPAQGPGAGADTSNGLFEADVDNREWPKPACPWTLPEGSDQMAADLLNQQYGCRYLSSCYYESKQCSYHYQGA